MCGVSRLPAFAEEFTAATPLTRIRDIAHRGDIPHELKQEIKHTIQVRVSALVPSCLLLVAAYSQDCMQLVCAEHQFSGAWPVSAEPAVVSKVQDSMHGGCETCVRMSMLSAFSAGC